MSVLESLLARIHWNFWNISWITMALILLLILLPLTIYFGLKYAVNLDHIVMRKRYSRIVIYECIIFVIKLISSALEFISMGIVINGGKSLYFDIVRMCNNNIAFLLYLTWTWRFYMLMYDVSWIIAAKNNHWQSILNPTYCNVTTNWFLDNRKTYGNLKWTFYHYFIPFFLISLLLQNFPTYFSLITNSKMTYNVFIKLFDPIFGSFPLILLAIVFYNTPKFHDKFFILAELKRILFALICQYIFFFITIGIRLIYPSSSLWLFSFFCTIVCEFIAMSIATIWVAMSIKGIIEEHKYNIRKFTSKSKQYVSIQSSKRRVGSINSTQTNNITDQILLTTNSEIMKESDDIVPLSNVNIKPHSLQKLLSYHQSFLSYMIQLAHEFSQETLLAFVEFIQYQQFIINYIHTHNLGIDVIKDKPKYEKYKQFS
eukprot:30086_1